MEKIELADQTMIGRYAYQVDVVLGILNHVGALVTDESTVGDFIDNDDEQMDIARLAELSDIFNQPVSLKTKIWELGRMICFEEIDLEGIDEQE